MKAKLIAASPILLVSDVDQSVEWDKEKEVPPLLIFMVIITDPDGYEYCIRTGVKEFLILQ